MAFPSSGNNSTSTSMPPIQPPQTTISSTRPLLRQIHRNRASYSCHSCRRRKVKCDRQHPTCGNCTKMAELCTYADNTGKGNRNKNKDWAAASATRFSSHSSSASPSPSATESMSQRSSKRLRMSQDTSATPASEGGWHSGCRSHSRSWSATHVPTVLSSPFRSLGPASTPPVMHPPVMHPPATGPLSSITREGELETRVNILTEIVDQWYRVAYSQTQRSSSPAGFNPEIAGPTAPPRFRNWPTPAQRPLEHPRPQSMLSTTRGQDSSDLTPRSPSIPGRTNVLSSPAPARGRSLREVDVSSTNFACCKDTGEGVAVGHLSIQGNGRSRYVGTGFWALLSGEIAELDQVLKSSNKPEPTFTTLPCGLSTPPHSSGSPCPSEDDLLSAFGNMDRDTGCGGGGKDVLSILHSLLSKKHCELLYRNFLDGVHPIMPLIHTPTFNTEWHRFWTWFPDNTHTPHHGLVDNSTFIPLLIAVLYAGAVSMGTKAIKASFEGRSKDLVTTRLFVATTSALSATAFPRSPTINSLTAFLIVQTCNIREEDPLSSYSFIGMAMQIAQQMGLHRDGSLFGLGDVECEVRRRVWWHITHLDIQGAIATGLPPLGGSSEDQFDTKMPSELRDEYIGTGRPRCPSSSLSPTMILAVGRHEATVVLRKIIVRLFGIKQPKKVDVVEMSQMIFGLKGKLDHRISRILVLGGEVEGGEREAIFNSWARVVLSMMSDRAYGLLYQPFLKSTKSRMWVHARSCALRSAHSFLRSYIHLSCSPLFAPYHWYCPGTSQPLHATVILLLDLHERPFAPEAPRSQIFVDEIFSLFPEHTSEAWQMLGRLRRRGKGVVKDSNGTGGGWEEMGWELEGWTDQLGLEPAVVLEEDEKMEWVQEKTFDWKEWDQVFGRFVEMEDQLGSPVGGWGLLDAAE